MRSGESSHEQVRTGGNAEAAASAGVYERLSKFEYDVFLSYSSRDRPRAAAVVERLKAAGLRVFWDRDILAGALWRPKLTKSLKASQCVLVLWSSAAKASAWVQAEAELAQKLGVLQQTLLEPLELEMPFNQYQLIADLSTWQPGAPHEALEQLVQKLKALLEPLADTENQLAAERLRQIRRTRLRQQALRAAAPVALGGGLLLASGGLDTALGLDTRVRLISVWARAALTDQRLDDAITFVRIDGSTKGSLERAYYDTWRPELALAVQNLAAQGADVIALDYTFEQDRVGTQALAGAIRAAREKGSAVVVGVKSWSQGQPFVLSPISEALRARRGSAPGYLGVACGGKEGRYATTVPVLVSKDQLEAKPSERLLPSLSFAIALAKWRQEKFEWLVDEDRIEIPGLKLSVPLSGSSEASSSVAECPVIAQGDLVAKLIIAQSPAESRWRSEVAFRDVVTSKAGLEDKVKGQICMIGDADERHSVWSGGPVAVPGVKLHADALSTLLNRTALRRLPPVSQLLLMLGLGTVAALVRFAIPPGRRSKRLALLIGLIGADLLLTVLSAAYLGLFVDAGYHVLAILVTYWYAERLEGRFFARPAAATSGEHS